MVKRKRTIGQTKLYRETSRRVWRYQRGNQNPYIEEEQTTQWPKEKVRKDKQRSTRHTYKTKDRETRTPLTTGGELRCSGRVNSSCSTSVYKYSVTCVQMTQVGIDNKSLVPGCLLFPNYVFRWPSVLSNT